jgi:hypothetical protein
VSRQQCQVSSHITRRRSIMRNRTVQATVAVVALIAVGVGVLTLLI